MRSTRQLIISLLIDIYYSYSINFIDNYINADFDFTSKQQQKYSKPVIQFLNQIHYSIHSVLDMVWYSISLTIKNYFQENHSEFVFKHITKETNLIKLNNQQNKSIPNKPIYVIS